MTILDPVVHHPTTPHRAAPHWVTPELRDELERLCPGGVHEHVSLAALSRWQIGGSADLVVSPRSVPQLAAVRYALTVAGVPSVVVGAGSNLLFADAGLRPVVIRLTNALNRRHVHGDLLHAEAGAFVPAIARTAMRAGRSGLEHICGIPGSLGGLLCMNGGSVQRSIGEQVVRVTSVTHDGRVIHRDSKDCRFGHGRSVFRERDEVVAAVALRVPERDDPAVIRRRMLDILRQRRSKFPLDLPNAGAVFVSDHEAFAQHGPPRAMIEKVGMMGRTVGGAMVSPAHANFIVNCGGASAADVLELSRQVRDRVAAKLGVWLRAQVRYVTEAGEILPLTEALDRGPLQ